MNMKQDYKKELQAFLSMKGKDVQSMCKDLLLNYDTFRQTAGYNTMRLAWCKFQTHSKRSLLLNQGLTKSLVLSKQVKQSTQIAIYLHSLKTKQNETT